jgi:hypothetical protein
MTDAGGVYLREENKRVEKQLAGLNLRTCSPGLKPAPRLVQHSDLRYPTQSRKISLHFVPAMVIIQG